jgi:LytR cell envelope-related transcriptional attenuator
MTSPTLRRPLPALVFLLALTLLTSLVWWRVMNRDNHPTAQPTCGPSKPAAVVPRPATVSVSVLNSTTRAGIAKSAAAALTKQGFKVAGYGNDTGHAPLAGVAEIRYSPDEGRAAILLTYYLPGASMARAKTTSQGVLVISLGKRYHAVATQQAVRASLAKNHISVATGTPRATPSAPC